MEDAFTDRWTADIKLQTGPDQYVHYRILGVAPEGDPNPERTAKAQIRKAIRDLRQETAKKSAGVDSIIKELNKDLIDVQAEIKELEMEIVSMNNDLESGTLDDEKKALVTEFVKDQTEMLVGKKNELNEIQQDIAKYVAMGPQQ
jgi:hypothetical protein